MHEQLRAHRHDELPQLLALAVDDLDARVELLLAVLDDDELATARGLIQLFADRLLVARCRLKLTCIGTVVVGHDRLGVRIPAEQQVSGSTVTPSSACSVAPYGTARRERTRSPRCA